ncbi:hypothetical protein CRG98_037490 [Punica granatum]|nr:hypothetical protein CRG98_037490 [Punica granatum]
MAKTETQQNQPQPPPGYPTENPPVKGRKKFFSRSKPKGERGFLEGCLFALCCCWICEECCF